MNNPYIRYLENALLAARKLASNAAEEEQRAEDRPARQYWDNQEYYWTKRANYLQRRLEEERKNDL